MAISIDDLSNALQNLTLTGVELLDQELGRGAYGKVSTVRHGGVVCAAKEIHELLIEISSTEEQERMKDNFFRECYHCSTLCHPNIVTFIGIYYPKKDSLFPMMIMELMGESLTKYVQKKNISMETKGFILYDVCFGLSYLHGHNPPVIHRDLSPNNILMSHDRNPVAKISDLGVAKIIKADRNSARMSKLTKAPGTVDFMPPECLEDNPKYNTSLDIFSYAGIVLHVVNQEWPTPTAQTLHDPETGKVTPLCEVERRQAHIDKIKDEADVLKPLVKACLDNDPSKRPEIADVFKMLEPLQVFHLKMASLGNVSKALPYLTLTGVTPLDQVLGHGAYGRVFKVNYHGTIYAAKEIHSNLLAGDQKIKDDFLQECYRCSILCHPNIVKFVGIYYSKKDFFMPMMVMELMGESLTNYVKRLNIDIDKKVFILCSVCSGLSYLHNCNPPIIHRDLSPNNILMSLEYDSVAKISDLGVARIIKPDGKATKLTKWPGTQDFMPPECQVDNPTYDTSLDIFSFASIVLHVVNQEWPTPRPQVLLDPQTGSLTALDEVERRQVYINKMKGKAEVLKPLVRVCLHGIPAKRPGIEDVLKVLKPLQESPPLAEALQSCRYHIKWTSCSNLPTPLYDVYVAVSSEAIYCTGSCPKEDNEHEVYAYNAVTDEWKQLPRPGHRLGVIHMVDDKLTIFGGRDSTTNEFHNRVTTYDSKANSWYRYYPNMLHSRHKPGVIICHDHVVVMGGKKSVNAFHDSIEVLSYHQLQWREASVHLPDAMWGVRPVISADDIVIVGYSGDEGCYADYCSIPVKGIIDESLSTDAVCTQWNKMSSSPYYDTVTVPYSNPPVILGGGDIKFIPTSDIMLYDTLKSSWRKVDSLTSARDTVGVALLNDSTIIVIGGATGGEGVEGAKASSLTTVEIGTIVPEGVVNIYQT